MTIVDTTTGHYEITGPGINSLVWPESIEGPQNIEFVVSAFGLAATIDTVAAECRRGDLVDKGIGLRAVVQKSANPALLAGNEWFYWIEFWDGTFYPLNHILSPTDPMFDTWTFGDPFTMRLESDVDGSVRFFIGNELIHADVVPGGHTGATNVGLWASKDEPSGAIVPEALSEPPVVTPLVAGEWTDDFERADGPIGPDWVQHPAGSDPFTIDSGAAVAPVATGAAVMYWHQPLAPGTQRIEIEVENAVGTAGWFTLHTNLDGDAYISQSAEIEFYDGGPGEEIFIILRGDLGEELATSDSVPYPAEPILLALESDADGAMRAYVNDTLAVSAVDPTPAVGGFVGIEIDPWSLTHGSPRILRASGSTVAVTGPFITDICINGKGFFDDFGEGEAVEDGWCDTFERAELGPDWHPGNVVHVIESGAVVSTVDTNTVTAGRQHCLNLANPNDPLTETQWVEAVVDRMFHPSRGFHLWCRSRMIGGLSNAGVHAVFSPLAGADLGKMWCHINTLPAVWPKITIPASPVTFRLESDPGGAARSYVNGALIVSIPNSFQGLGGPYVGFTTSFTLLISGGTNSPQVLSACGSGGPLPPGLAADWVLGLTRSVDEIPELPTLEEGAAVGPANSGGVPYPVATMSWNPPLVATDQSVEVVFENWYWPEVGASATIEIYCFGGGGAEPQRQARRACEFRQAMSGGLPEVTVRAYTYLDTGVTTLGATSTIDPPTGTVTLRLDSYGDGLQVVTLNGEVIITYTETGTPFSYLGHQQGVWMSWTPVPDRTSPRILSVRGEVSGDCGGTVPIDEWFDSDAAGFWGPRDATD